MLISTVAAKTIRQLYPTRNWRPDDYHLNAETATVARALVDKSGKIILAADDLTPFTSTGATTIISAGAYTATLTFTATTGVTFPTSGTLATRAGTESLSAKTLVSPVISTGLTASGSASNDFSASTGAFKTSTGQNTFGGKVAFKVISTAVAAAGSDVSGAAALGSANMLHISSDSAAKGVILQTGVAGDKVDIVNDSATAAILYPATGGTINGLSANAGVLIPASKGTFLECRAADTWVAFDRPAKSTAA